MTDAAKWMINCVAELRGRYGKAILFGTLQGANRARLRELGAERFKSYGRMKDTPRETLERLLAQLLEDGYLVQSDDQYAVLHIGDIAPLKAGGQVLVKLPQQREPEQTRAPKPKRRSPMDALTSAGLELFNQLRQLRFDTAQREGLRPTSCSVTSRWWICVCARRAARRICWASTAWVSASMKSTVPRSLRSLTPTAPTTPTPF